MSGLKSVVETAEDHVFDAFCRRLRVENIREYEGRQLKLAQEESDARLRFSTQIARLNTSWVHLSPVSILFWRVFSLSFEKGRLQDLHERLESIEKAAVLEKNNLQTHNSNLKATQSEVEEAEKAVEELKEELKGLNSVSEEKSKDLEAAKREHDRANKALEKVLKDISSRVSST